MRACVRSSSSSVGNALNRKGGGKEKREKRGGGREDGVKRVGGIIQPASLRARAPEIGDETRTRNGRTEREGEGERKRKKT